MHPSHSFRMTWLFKAQLPSPKSSHPAEGVTNVSTTSTPYNSKRALVNSLSPGFPGYSRPWHVRCLQTLYPGKPLSILGSRWQEESRQPSPRDITEAWRNGMLMCLFLIWFGSNSSTSRILILQQQVHIFRVSKCFIFTLNFGKH